MAFSEDIELLDEYNRWRAGRKGDTTPEKFIAERASETALARLIKIEDYIDQFDSVQGERGEMVHYGLGIEIKRIINGERD